MSRLEQMARVRAVILQALEQSEPSVYEIPKGLKAEFSLVLRFRDGDGDSVKEHELCTVEMPVVEQAGEKGTRVPFVMSIEEAKHMTAPIPARYFAQLNVDRTLEPCVLAVFPQMVPILVTIGPTVTALSPAGEEMYFDAGLIASPGHILRAWFTRKPEKAVLIAKLREP